MEPQLQGLYQQHTNPLQEDFEEEFVYGGLFGGLGDLGAQASTIATTTPLATSDRTTTYTVSGDGFERSSLWGYTHDSGLGIRDYHSSYPLATDLRTDSTTPSYSEAQTVSTRTEAEAIQENYRGEQSVVGYNYWDRVPRQEGGFFAFHFIRRQEERLDPEYMRLFRGPLVYYKCQCRIDFQESLSRSVREARRVKDRYWYGIAVFRFPNIYGSFQRLPNLVRSVECFLNRGDSDFITYLPNFDDVRRITREIVRSDSKRSMYLTPDVVDYTEGQLQL